MNGQWIPLSQAYEHVRAVFFVPSRVEEELLRVIRATHVATKARSLAWSGSKTGEVQDAVLDRDFWRENNIDERGAVSVKWLKNSARSARNTYNGGIEVAQAEGIEVHARQLFNIWPEGEAHPDARTDGATDKTGSPGRPSSRHLVEAEFKERVKGNRTESSLKAEAKVLSAWLREKHPTLTPMTVKTVENSIRLDYNRHKKK
ncbi:hypothetical protein [Bradyrhizobium sp. Mp64]|uniref:hypothetical protein n=1 Tax=Bradyrhizobium sp. Mp64 TaxID=3042158 RepID=UPI00248C9258|nr:hypothetical protein [Bradyrhizobium sp. Mp64]MDI2103928.1 hypothetical protein [Bradyrhizobium sp. Mp64]